jgi:hypothetical protein
MSSPTPEKGTLPHFGLQKGEKVKLFAGALISRCLHRDRAIFAAQNHIGQFVGTQFNESSNVSLDNVAAEEVTNRL